MKSLGRFIRREPVVVTLLALAFAISAFLWMRWQDRRDVDVGVLRGRLDRALGGFRPPVGRLVGFGYTKESVAGRRLDKGVLHQVREIDRLCSRLPVPDRLWLGSAIELLRGNPRKAVSQLERATELKPQDSKFLSDLSAAYLSLANSAREPYYLFLAHSAAEKARKLGPDSVEAAFNQAEALGSFFLRERALATWEGYIRSERDSAWRAEASSKIKFLRQARNRESWGRVLSLVKTAALRGNQKRVTDLISGFTQEAREYAEGELLGLWGESVLAGSSEEERSRLIGRTIGLAIQDTTGDRMLVDSIAVIDGAFLRGDNALLLALARGHKLYWTALQKNPRIDPAASGSLFKEAASLLGQCRTPFMLWAEFGYAVSQYHRAEYQSALTSLARANNNPQFSKVLRGKYPILCGRIAWIEGLIRSDRGEFTAALESLLRAQTLFTNTRQIVFLGAVHRLQADALLLLGDTYRSWAHLYEALNASSGTPDSIRRLAAFEQASLAARKEREPQIALYFEEEGLSGIKEDSQVVAGSVALLAELQLEAGHREQSYRSLQRARRLAGNITDNEVRRNLQADVSRIEASLANINKDPEKVKILLTEAIDVYGQSGFSFYLPKLYLDRALAYSSLDDQKNTEKDLALGIAELERQRKSLDAQLRVSLLDNNEKIFQEMVVQQVRHGFRVAEAFKTAELSRARLLAEGMDLDGKSVRVASLEEVRAALPPDVLLISYFFLPGQIVSWGVSSRQSRFVMQDLVASDLAQSMSAMLKRENPLSGKLYHLLIAPMQDLVDAAQVVVFVPQGPLCEVPFAALINPETHRYLIESVAVGQVPSATLFLRALRNIAGNSVPERARVLVIGNSEFDRKAALGLPSLKYAAEEVGQIAAIFEKSDAVVGREATKERFLLGSRYTAVHFVGHTVINPNYPLLSSFLMSPKEGNDGVLFASEIYKQRQWKTRLVTLSSCSSAAGRLSSSEGLESLARPFLAIGVVSVVGNLWDTKDVDAGALFAEFYKALMHGEDSWRALRSAQLKLLRSRQGEAASPVSWAGFTHFGAAVRLAQVR